ncbi:Adenylyl cyclase class-3/4/guanylyl cyclase [Pseudocohnilembus persalinus]|uniref:adenylate cyclase n=1 Tax=Pseudocohnilembus persalinus TaxID=266149 RepID=A0A0V0QCX9_PSEPJ|nr:Adenylyl cyclase class-3/4/guanylyl cyclase [Pseudocohnilembus persalinus]|eukprot:KRX00071.1 Adenylyl cyclase class-3/4/guanylyl cyclase [Pseudocohnilembus persalinus]
MKYFHYFKQFYHHSLHLNNQSKPQALLQAYQKSLKIKKHHKSLKKTFNLSFAHYLPAFYFSSKATQQQKANEAKLHLLLQKKQSQRNPSPLSQSLSNSLQTLQKQQHFLQDLEIPGQLQNFRQRFTKFTKKDALKKLLEPKQILLFLQFFRSNYNKYLLDKIQLYQSALQNLLEGKREVMQNENFKLQDGQTVKQKMEQFELFLKTKMPNGKNYLVIVLIPIVIQFIVICLKEFYNDIQKKKHDQSQNTRHCYKFKNLHKLKQDSQEENEKDYTRFFQFVEWQNLQIGDLVILHENDYVPADMLLLDMWEDYCGVNERYLTDKTNIVMKQATQLTKRDSLEHQNILRRNTVIKYSNWVVGIVLFAGNDTYEYQLHLNGAHSRASQKQSIYYQKIHIFQIISVLIIIFYSVLVYISQITQQCYLDFEEKGNVENLNYWSILFQLSIFSPFYLQIFQDIVIFINCFMLSNHSIILNQSEQISDFSQTTHIMMNNTNNLTEDQYSLRAIILQDKIYMIGDQRYQPTEEQQKTLDNLKKGFAGHQIQQDETSNIKEDQQQEDESDSSQSQSSTNSKSHQNNNNNFNINQNPNFETKKIFKFTSNIPLNNINNNNNSLRCEEEEDENYFNNQETGEMTSVLTLPNTSNNYFLSKTQQQNQNSMNIFHQDLLNDLKEHNQLNTEISKKFNTEEDLDQEDEDDQEENQYFDNSQTFNYLKVSRGPEYQKKSQIKFLNPNENPIEPESNINSQRNAFDQLKLNIHYQKSLNQNQHKEIQNQNQITELSEQENDDKNNILQNDENTSNNNENKKNSEPQILIRDFNLGSFNSKDDEIQENDQSNKNSASSPNQPDPNFLNSSNQNQKIKLQQLKQKESPSFQTKILNREYSKTQDNKENLQTKGENPSLVPCISNGDEQSLQKKQRPNKKVSFDQSHQVLLKNVQIKNQEQNNSNLATYSPLQIEKLDSHQSIQFSHEASPKKLGSRLKNYKQQLLGLDQQENQQFNLNLQQQNNISNNKNSEIQEIQEKQEQITNNTENKINNNNNNSSQNQIPNNEGGLLATPYKTQGNQNNFKMFRQFSEQVSYHNGRPIQNLQIETVQQKYSNKLKGGLNDSIELNSQQQTTNFSPKSCNQKKNTMSSPHSRSKSSYQIPSSPLKKRGSIPLERRQSMSKIVFKMQNIKRNDSDYFGKTKRRNGSSLSSPQKDKFEMENQNIETEKQLFDLIEKENDIPTDIHEVFLAMLLCTDTISKYNEKEKKSIHTHYTPEDASILDFPQTFGYIFKSQCFIDKQQTYVLKYFEETLYFNVMKKFHYPEKKLFAILCQGDDEEAPSIYIKQELSELPSYIQGDQMEKVSFHKIKKTFYQKGLIPFLYARKYLDQETYMNKPLFQELQRNPDSPKIESLFFKEIEQGTAFLTIIGVQQKIKKGVQTVINTLQKSSKKLIVSTGESLSRTQPVCRFLGILNPSLRKVHFNHGDHEKLVFKIKNELTFIKNVLLNQENKLNNSNNSPESVAYQRSPLRKMVNNERYSTASPSRKSVLLNFDPDDNVKIEILVSGPAFHAIHNNQYLLDHFCFIAYFSQSIVAYDFSAQQKKNLLSIFKNQLESFFKVSVIGNTVQDIPLVNSHKSSIFLQQTITLKLNDVQQDIQNLIEKKQKNSNKQQSPKISTDFPQIQKSKFKLQQETQNQLQLPKNSIPFNENNSNIQNQDTEGFQVKEKIKKYLQISAFCQAGSVTLDNLQILMRLIFILARQQAELLDELIIFSLYSSMFILTTITLIQMNSCQSRITYFTPFTPIFVNLINYLLLSILQFTSKSHSHKKHLKEKIKSLFDFRNGVQQQNPQQSDSNRQKNISNQFSNFHHSNAPEIRSELEMANQQLNRNKNNSNNNYNNNNNNSKSIINYQIFEKKSSLMGDSFKQISPVKKKRDNFKKITINVILQSYFKKSSSQPYKFALHMLKTLFLSILDALIIYYAFINLSQNGHYPIEVESFTFQLFFCIVPIVKLFILEGCRWKQGLFLLITFIIELFILQTSEKEYQRYGFYYIQDLDQLQYIFSVLLCLLMLAVFHKIQILYIFFYNPKLILNDTKFQKILNNSAYIAYTQSIKDFNIGKILRRIFKNSENDLILQSFLLSDEIGHGQAKLKYLSKKFENTQLEYKFLRLFKKNNLPSTRYYILISVVFYDIVNLVFYFISDKKNDVHTLIFTYGNQRKNFISEFHAINQSKQVKDLLSLLLPKFIRERIDNGQSTISENQGNVSLIFCDVANFDDMINEEQEQVVYLLDKIYRDFDIACSLHSLQKIETVGKTYMAAGGLKDVEHYYNLQNQKKLHNSAQRAIDFAFEMFKIVKSYQFGRQVRKDIQLKIGIHYGQVIAGVIGHHKPQFSLIGDTVNTTSRVGSTSEAGYITISQQAYEQVQKNSNYLFRQRAVQAKGKGELMTYQVIDRKSVIDLLINAEIKENTNLQNRRMSIQQFRKLSLKTFENTSEGQQIKDKIFSEYTKRGGSVSIHNISKKSIDFTAGMQKILMPIKETNTMSEINTNSKPSNYEQSKNDHLEDFGCIDYSFIDNLEDQGKENIHLEKYRGRDVLNYKIEKNSIFQLEEEEDEDNEWLFSNNSKEYNLKLGLFAKPSNPELYDVYMDAVEIELIYYFILVQVLFFFFDYRIKQVELISFNNLQHLDEKKLQYDSLVNYLLPKHLLDQFLHNPLGKSELTEKYETCTILFADIAGFTKYSSSVKPDQVVQLLRKLFIEFDKLCLQNDVFKLYTIGDCYVCLGVNDKNNRQYAEEAQNVLNLGFEMIKIIQDVRKQINYDGLNMRIGIHTGTVIGGMIGTEVVRYDIYGRDVLIANKCESHGTTGYITVSEATKNLLKENFEDLYQFELKEEFKISAQGYEETIPLYYVTQQD